jgi:SAM-dependent methyltransferase
VSPSKNEAAWSYQWNTLEDDSEMLFREWIRPVELDDFRDKLVLDAGCGGGQHMRFVAPYASEVVGVDLSCSEIAARKSSGFENVSAMEADIATMDLGRQFDIVYSIGVLHHTDDPRAAFQNLARHVRPGGRLIVWVYSHEGNLLNRVLVEPLKRVLYGRWPRPVLLGLARVLTALLYLPVYTVYLLPLRFLPYHAYFGNFRRLGFQRNLLNVFDKLNAPQTVFLERGEVASWFAEGFRDVSIESYMGVSWSASAVRVGPA